MGDRILVLVRHGESEWNKKNLFTGWRDVGLTENGINEARTAGRWIKAQGLRFDVGFTSALIRAQHSLDLVLEEVGQRNIRCSRTSAQRARLRRSLRPQQGRRARQMGSRAGAPLAALLRRRAARRREPQGHRCARAALLHPGHLPRVLRGENVLVAAHGNSLRALVMVLERLSPEKIVARELATGLPLVYRLNADSTVAEKRELAM